MTLSSITNSTCTYSDFTASVSLVTRLTSWPVMAPSKKRIGSRSTWPYTCSRMRCTARIASPASRTSWPVTQPARQAAGDQGAAEQADDGRDVGIARQQVAVDEGLAEQRPQGFQRGGHHQPHRGAFQQGGFGQRCAPQQLQRRAALGGTRHACVRRCVIRHCVIRHCFIRHSARPPAAARAIVWRTSRRARPARGACRAR